MASRILIITDQRSRVIEYLALGLLGDGYDI